MSDEICPISKIEKYRYDNINYLKNSKYHSFDCYITEDEKYKIKIFENKCDMDTYTNMELSDAVCINYRFDRDEDGDIEFTRNDGKKYTDRMGELIFYRYDLEDSYVVHEVTHMILQWFRCGYDNAFEELENGNEGYDELMAYLVADCFKYITYVLSEYNIK